jgi:hypothetical protein
LHNSTVDVEVLVDVLVLLDVLVLVVLVLDVEVLVDVLVLEVVSGHQSHAIGHVARKLASKPASRSSVHLPLKA